MKTKLITLFLLIPFLQGVCNELSGTLHGSFFLRLQLGSQLQAIQTGVSVFGTARYNSTAMEGGINLSFSPFLQKFGVHEKGFEGTMELFALLGYGKNDNLLGANIGLFNPYSFYDETKNNNRFYGIGGTVILNRLSGDLKKFENAQGGLLIRLSNSRNSFTINNLNDATAKPFARSGTDKGFTARMRIKYSRIDENELLVVGFGFDMFTPEADYGRVPRNVQNSEEGMRIVTYNTKPYDQLYHFNLFGLLNYQSDDYILSGKIGLDHPKMGGWLQNKLHDSFGLYSRFDWPIENKAKFYGLLEGGRNFNERIDD